MHLLRPIHLRDFLCCEGAMRESTPGLGRCWQCYFLSSSQSCGKRGIWLLSMEWIIISAAQSSRYYDAAMEL